MSRQYAWVLVAGLALAGCGGGGGGGGGSSGGDNSGDPGATVDRVTTADLAGTWMRSEATYVSGVWQETHHQTFTLTSVSSSSLDFTDCMVSGALRWTLGNNQITRTGQPALNVEKDGDQISLSATGTDGTTQIQFKKLNNNATKPIVVTVHSLDVFGNTFSSWDKVCLNTHIRGDAAEDEITILVSGKADNLSGVVKMEFVSPGFSAGNLYYYDWLHPQNEITGSLSGNYLGIPVSRNLQDPVGDMSLATSGDDVEMSLDLTLGLNTSIPGTSINSIDIEGDVTFASDWLQGDPNQ